MMFMGYKHLKELKKRTFKVPFFIFSQTILNHFDPPPLNTENIHDWHGIWQRLQNFIFFVETYIYIIFHVETFENINFHLETLIILII